MQLLEEAEQTLAPSKAARQEAATGLWLAELDGQGPLRAVPPGMRSGFFGAWRTMEEDGGGEQGAPAAVEQGTGGLYTAPQPPLASAAATDSGGDEAPQLSLQDLFRCERRWSAVHSLDSLVARVQM